MKQFYLLLSLLLLAGVGLAQTITPRTDDTTTPLDERLAVGKTLSIPYGPTPTLNGGLDRMGSLFFNTTDSLLYIYKGAAGWKPVGGGKAKLFTYTASGNGITDEFTVPHGLGFTPSMVMVTPGSTDAVTGGFDENNLTSINALRMYAYVNGANIKIKYREAPVTGTNNLTWTILVADPRITEGSNIITGSASDSTTYRTVANSFTKAETNTLLSGATGAFTIVADSVERNAIAQVKRKSDMVVIQQNNHKLYRLNGAITGNDWKEIFAGGATEAGAGGSKVKMFKYTTSGNGSTYEFTVPHGLGFTPAMVTATPSSTDAVTGGFYEDNAAQIDALRMYAYVDGLNIKIRYPSGNPPKSGFNNLTWTILVADPRITDEGSDIITEAISDSTLFRTVANSFTKAETNTLLSGKQSALVSGTNIKTINGTSILGSGNITISVPNLNSYVPYSGATNNLALNSRSLSFLTGTYSNTIGPGHYHLDELGSGNTTTIKPGEVYTRNTGSIMILSPQGLQKTNTVADATNTLVFTTPQTTNKTIVIPDKDGTLALTSDLDNKQNSLISGSNIKTINGTSILGSGDISILAGGDESNLVHKTGDEAISGSKTFTSGLSTTGLQTLGYVNFGDKIGYNAMSAAVSLYAENPSGNRNNWTFRTVTPQQENGNAQYALDLPASSGTIAVIDGYGSAGTLSKWVNPYKLANAVPGTDYLIPSGLKTINGNSILGSGDITTSLGYTAANDADVIHKTGYENIDGVKVFTNNNGLTYSKINGTSISQLDNVGNYSDISATAIEINGPYPGGYRVGFNPNGFFKRLSTDRSTDINFAQPTANNSITIPDASGTVALISDLNAKQNNLISGTNIKTINGNSIIGSGDLSVAIDESTLVHKTGTETISGSKTFTSGLSTTGLQTLGYVNFGDKIGYNAMSAAVSLYAENPSGNRNNWTFRTATPLQENGNAQYALDLPASSGTIAVIDGYGSAGTLSKWVNPYKLANAVPGTDYLIPSGLKTINGKSILGSGDISVTDGYVPYTGATSNLSMGSNSINFSAFSATNNINAGQSILTDSFGNEGSLYASNLTFKPSAGSANAMIFNYAGFEKRLGGFTTTLTFTTPTAGRNLVFPDASGMLVTTDNLGSYLPLAGGTLTGALNGTTGMFSGSITGASIVKAGGTSSEFLKANGSVDNTVYQPSLVSGTNIKTINGNSIIGGGDLTVTPTYGTIAGTVAQGNDSRISNGQTAFGWGNHADAGYATSLGVVHKVGAETIGGIKTFTDQTVLNNTLTGTSASFSGKVGIGTTSPDMTLTVKGKIHAEEVKVDLNVPGPDYVFEKNYDLKSLDEVEKYISANKHLPEIPSAKTMEKEGISMGDMQMKLLQKVEELTLYIIDQNKRANQQDKVIAKQQEEINNLKAKVK
ncbi:MAG: hypothetical protein H7Y13_16255 [Sphingobacteriaceae bacterium]|nr:hypothetical protein [Sphingobacteriaceae bacterium]